MNILLRDFNVKVGRDDIFKPTIRNENFHEISNDNGVSVANFSTSKNLIVKNTVLTHCNIHKCTWRSQDGKPHNHIDNILIDRRRYSCVLDVRSFRAADCHPSLSLAVEMIRERLAVNRIAHISYREVQSEEVKCSRG
jgi:hypothetical protein